MGDLTHNFSRHEFSCTCGCGFDTVDFELLNALQAGADHFADLFDNAIWVDVTSGCRCRGRNNELRARAEQDNTLAMPAADSQHIYGRAADFKLYLRLPRGKRGEQIPPGDVADWYEKHFAHFGIGRYHNRTHIDSRSTGGARWGQD